jgi:hypothetical protein
VKAQYFLEWMKAADVRFAADITRLIGIERTTAQRWINAARNGEDVPVRRPFALAMAAVAQGLEPWGEPEPEESPFERGRRDAVDGKDVSESPYQDGTDDHVEWALGWHAGEGMMKDGADK